jgi:hypothetical protein
MEKTGFGDKPLWGTEFGAPTVGITVAGKGKRADHVSEALQSQIISEGIKSWYAKQNVGPLMVHSDSDQWLAKRKNENGFGLRRSNGTKKPAYEAFRKAVTGLK